MDIEPAGMLICLFSLGRTGWVRRLGTTFPPLPVGYSDVAFMAKGLQIIVVVPTSKAVTATTPGHDMIDLDPSPWGADPAMLARPLVTASD